MVFSRDFFFQQILKFEKLKQSKFIVLNYLKSLEHIKTIEPYHSFTVLIKKRVFQKIRQKDELDKHQKVNL